MELMPSKKELEQAVISILSKHKSEIRTADIDNLVAAELAIPDNVLEIEDANCTGTEYKYQMRWVRTKLKNEGLIQNTSRGYWKII